MNRDFPSVFLLPYKDIFILLAIFFVPKTSTLITVESIMKSVTSSCQKALGLIPGGYPVYFFSSNWLTNVDEMEDLWL